MNYLLPKEIRTLLTNWALRPDSLTDLKEIFGPVDNKSSRLLEQIRGGDFAWVPDIRVLPVESLPGAWGAYARATSTIYLSDECPSDELASVLLEEIGHHIDAILNRNETPGDEGALFSAAVLGEPLTPEEITALLNEDDSAVITLGGLPISVECKKIVRKKSVKKSTARTAKVSTRTAVNPIAQPLAPAAPTPTLGAQGDSLSINTNTYSPNPETLPSADIYAQLYGSQAFTLTGNSNATNYLDASMMVKSSPSLTGSVSLRAGSGETTILGGAGEGNTLDGGTSTSAILLKGGKGNATLKANNGRATLLGGSGNNSLIAGQGVRSVGQNLKGGGATSSNTLIGGYGADTLFGGDGVNTLISGSTTQAHLLVASGISSSLVAGLANDTLAVNFTQGGSSTLNGYHLEDDGSGNMVLKDGSNGVTLVGASVAGSSSYLISGSNSFGAQDLVAHGGNTTLEACAGADTLWGSDTRNVFLFGKSTIDKPKLIHLSTLASAKNTLGIKADSTYAVSDNDLGRFSGQGTLQGITNYGPGSASITLGQNALSAFQSTVAGAITSTNSGSNYLQSATILAGNAGDTVQELAQFQNVALSLQGGSSGDRLIVDNFTQLLQGVFNGNSGNDSLQINTSSTLDDSVSFKNTGNENFLSSVEVLKLSDSVGSSNQVSLGVNAANLGFTSVYGGQGSDTIAQLAGSGSMLFNAKEGTDLVQVYNSTYLSADTVDGGAGLDTLQIGVGLFSTLNEVDSNGNPTGLKTVQGTTLNTAMSDLLFNNISNIEALSLNGGATSVTNTLTGDTTIIYGTSTLNLGNIAFNSGLQSVFGSDGGNTITQSSAFGPANTRLVTAAAQGATALNVSSTTGFKVGDTLQGSGMTTLTRITGIDSVNFILSIDTALSGAMSVGTQISDVATLNMWGGLGKDIFNISTANLRETISGYSQSEINNTLPNGTLALSTDTLNTVRISGTSAINHDFLKSLQGIQKIEMLGGAGNAITLGANDLNTISGGTGFSTILTGAGADTVNGIAYTTTLTVDATNTRGFSSLTGSASYQNMFLLSDSSAIGTSTITGGAVLDTLVSTRIGNTLLDQEFKYLHGIEVLSLQGAATVLAGDNARLANITSIYGGSGNDSIIQDTTNSLHLYINGGNGSNSYLFYNQELLKNDISVVGGSGADSITVISNDTLATPSKLLSFNDSDFANISSVENLVLRGTAQVTLGSTAKNSGIRSVYGISGDDTMVSNVENTSLLGGSGSTSLVANAAYVSLRGGAENYATNTLVANNNNDSVSSGGSGDLISLNGRSDFFFGGASGDVVKVTNVDAFVSLGSGNDLLIFQGNSDSLLSSPDSSLYSAIGDFLSSTLKGSGGLDTLAINQALTSNGGYFNDNFSNISSGAIDALSLASGSKVILGANAESSGISTVQAAAGNSTVDASSYSTKNFTFDLRNSLGGTSATNVSLLGDNTNTLVGTNFIVSDTSAITTNTFVGGAGKDTLSFLQSKARNLSLNINDTLFNTSNLKNGIEFLQLSTNTLGDNLYAGNSLTLGANASSVGIATVTGSKAGDTITQDTLFSSLSLYGGANSSILIPGNDLYIFNKASYMDNDTINGVSGVDTIQINDRATLFDINFNNISNIDVLKLSGNSSVTLDTLAQKTGITTIIAGNGNTTFNQLSGDTQSLSLAGSLGNDYFNIANTTQLGRDTIAGNAGNDTLKIASAATLNDSFTKITSVEVLQLSADTDSESNAILGSSVTLSGSAKNAGFTLVSGGIGDDTIIQTSLNNNIQSINAAEGSDYISVANQSQLISEQIDGGAGIDTLSVNASNLTSDFSQVSGIENLLLTLSGTSAVTIGDLGDGTNAIITAQTGTTKITQSYVNISTSLTSGAAIGATSITVAKNTNFQIGNTITGDGIKSNTSISNIVSSGGNYILTLSEGITKSLSTGSRVVNADYSLNFTGNSGNDTIEVATSAQLSVDSLNGGAGIDVLQLDGAANKSDTLSNVNIEIIKLNAEGNYLRVGESNTGILTIVGGVGNDTIDVSAYPNSSTLSNNTLTTWSPLVIDASGIQSGNGETIIGSTSTLSSPFSNSNKFIFATQTALQNSSIVAGSGVDTLIINQPVNLITSNLKDSLNNDRINGVEVLSLTGGSSVTLGTHQTFSSVYGGFGNNTFTQLASDTLSQALVGNSLNDLFNIANTSILANDTINGGSGSGTDTLFLQSADKNIQDVSFASVTGIEVLSLTGSSSVSLGASARTSGINAVYGGNGASTISQLAADTLSLEIHGGNSGGNLIYIEKQSQFIADSSISGGSGSNDTLTIDGTSTLYDTQFTNVSGIEILQLSASLNSSAQPAVGSAVYFNNGTATRNGLEAVNGGAYNNTISHTDTSYVGIGGGSLSITGGDRNDQMILGDYQLNNTISSYRDEVDGGSQSATSLGDTLVAYEANVNNASFDKITGIEALSLQSASTLKSQINLTDTTAQNEGILTIYGGESTNLINANGFQQGVTLDGSASTVTGSLLTISSSLNAGYGNTFTLTGANSIYAGTRNDSIIGSKGSDYIKGYVYNASNTNSDLSVDTLNGGNGAGADLYILGDLQNNSYSTGLDKDYALIKDFDISKDKIVLHKFSSSKAAAVGVSTLAANSNFQTLSGSTASNIEGSGDYSINSVWSTQSVQGGAGPSDYKPGQYLYTELWKGTEILAKIYANAGSGNVLNILTSSIIVNSSTDTLSSQDTVVGGSGTDTLYITKGVTLNDSAFANVKAIEAISTSNANNSIALGSLAGSAGIKSVFGGSGSDTFDASSYTGSITLSGGDGANSITGSSNADSITAGSGNDTIAGGGGADTIVAGAGNDLLIFDTAANMAAASIDGGAGTNTISLSSGSQVLVDSNFSRITTGTIEVLSTSNGSNNVVLGSIAQTAGIRSLNGGTGNDTIDASAYTAGIAISSNGGYDSILSGSGNDLLIFTDEANLTNASTISGGSGTDTISITSDSQVITDTDFFKVAPGSVEVFQTGEGDNSVTLDIYASTAGITTLIGGSGDDTLNTTAVTTAMAIVSGGGADSILAGNGNDTITFNDSANMAGSFANGGAGNNTIVIALDGQTVTDADFADIKAVQNLNFAGGSNLVTIGANALSAGITSLVGSAGNDTLDASSSSYASTSIYMQESQGNNSLVGNAEDDTFIGGSGNDTILGGGGADSIVAGDGNDLLVFTTSTNMAAASAIDGGLGINTISLLSGSQTVLDSNFSNIAPGTIQVLSTSNGTNAVVLAAKAQSAGISSLTGGSGNDTFDGRAFSNNLSMLGNGGADSLLGGSGNDAFYTSSTNLNTVAKISGGGGSDAITITNDSSVVTDASFLHVSGVETFRTSNGSNSLTIDTNAQTAGIVSVFGGSGSDTINATTYTTGVTVTGNGGADSILTGSGNDMFILSNTDQLASVATLLGGSGQNTLSFTSDSQSIVDSLFSHSYQIGAIKTGNGNNSIYLGANTKDAGILSLYGGSGNDTMNISSVAYLQSNSYMNAGDGNNYIIANTGNDTVIAGSGNDTITAGGGADSIVAGNGNNLVIFGSGTDLTNASTVAGGTGTDTVKVLSLATLSDAAFAKFSDINVLQLANTLSSATGNTVTLAGNALSASITTIIGGSGNDSFNVTAANFAADSINGNGGTDTLALSTDAQTIVDASFTKLSNIKVFKTADGANSLTLATNAASAGIATVIGGLGNDIFNVTSAIFAADSIAGGGGIDTLALSTDAQTIGDAAFARFPSIEVFKTANGANSVTFAGNAVSAGITTIIGGSGNDSFTVNASIFSADSIAGGSGTDTLALSTDAQTIADSAFTKLSAIEVFRTANGNNSVTLSGNAVTTGILTLIGGSGNDSFNVTAGIFATDSIVGGSGTDTLAISTDSQTIADSALTKLSAIEVIQTANGNNSITIGSNAKTAGINGLIGGTGNDSFSAISYTTAVTLNGGGTAVAADTLTGGSGSTSDLFILGNSGATSTYYGTTTQGTANYAIVTSLASNTLVGGQATSDKLQLNLADYTANKYTLGNYAGNGLRTITHFGLYDNGKFVGDITTSGFTVANNGSQDAAFLNASNNHVTYVV